MTTYRTITFLTDFGVQDDYAGVCRGVMKQIAPDAQIELLQDVPRNFGSDDKAAPPSA